MLVHSVLNSPSVHGYCKTHVLFIFIFVCFGAIVPVGIFLPSLKEYFLLLKSGINFYVFLKFENFTRICQVSFHQPYWETHSVFQLWRIYLFSSQSKFLPLFNTSLSSVLLFLFGALTNYILECLELYYKWLLIYLMISKYLFFVVCV